MIEPVYDGAVVTLLTGSKYVNHNLHPESILKEDVQIQGATTPQYLRPWWHVNVRSWGYVITPMSDSANSEILPEL